MIRLFLVWACLAGSVHAQSQPPDCVVAAIDLRQGTAAAFHAEITSLVSAADPALAETARAAEEAQSAMRAVRRARVLHLVASEPAVLTSETTLSEVMNLQGDETSLDALRAANPNFAELEERRTTAIARTQGHPEMERIRTLVRSDLAEDITAAAERLNTEMARADALLRTCLN
ncbi:MAG: hypothetical protein AAGA19_14515 [Pseudomonadota bacterium]